MEQRRYAILVAFSTVVALTVLVVVALGAFLGNRAPPAAPQEGCWLDMPSQVVVRQEFTATVFARPVRSDQAQASTCSIGPNDILTVTAAETPQFAIRGPAVSTILIRVGGQWGFVLTAPADPGVYSIEFDVLARASPDSAPYFVDTLEQSVAVRQLALRDRLTSFLLDSAVGPIWNWLVLAAAAAFASYAGRLAVRKLRTVRGGSDAPSQGDR
jgi:hypothetical protein